MSVPLSDVDEQLSLLGEVPEGLAALVQRHGGGVGSLAEADAILAALSDGSEPVASMALLVGTGPGVVAEAANVGLEPEAAADSPRSEPPVPEEATDRSSVVPPPPTLNTRPVDEPLAPASAPPGTFSELPAAPPAQEAMASSEPEPLVEEPLFADEIAAADAALFDNEVEAAWASQAPPAPSHPPVGLMGRAPRVRRDTMRDEPSVPPAAMEVEFDADLDPAALVPPATPREATPVADFDMGPGAEAGGLAAGAGEEVDDLFGDLERPADGTVTALYDGGAPEPQRVAVSVPPPLRGREDIEPGTARADQTGDFELLFDDEIEEIAEDELELIE